MKRFKKIVLLLLASGFLLLLGGGAWLYWQQDRLTRTVIAGLNDRLAAPVSVQEVGLSFRRFPAVAIRMSRVFSAGHPQARTDTLLSAEAVYLEMDLWKLITGPVEVQRIAVENGTLQLKTNAQGQTNYRIWKEEGTAESAAQFSLKALEINQMRTVYHHVPSHFRTVAHISSAELRGTFSGQAFSLMAALNTEVRAVQQGGKDYLLQPQKLETLLAIKQQKGKLQLHSRVLRLPGLAQGNLHYRYQADQQKLELTLPHLSVAPAWQFLHAQEYLPALPLEMEGSLACTLTWAQKGDRPPDLHLAYGPDQPLVLRSSAYGHYGPLQIRGRYHRSAGRDTLWIEELKQVDEKAPLHLSGRVIHLQSPQIEGQLQADWPLEHWTRLLPGDSLQAQHGRARVELRLRGKYPNWATLKKPEWIARTRLNGSVVLEKGRLKLPALDWRLKRINGEVVFNGDQVKIERLFAAKGKSDLYLRGRLGNVLNYLLFPDEPLQVDAHLRSQKLVVEDFLDQRTGKGRRMARPLEYTRRLQLKLNLAIDELRYASFAAQEVAGALQIASGKIEAQNLSMKADGGRYQGQMTLRMPPKGPYQLQARVDLSSLQLRSVFASFQNFGQQTLTARHLTGQAWLEGQLQAQVAPHLELLLPSLKMTGTLRIENGRLQSFKPMLALSDYAALEALKDVQFARLQNDIRIENEWIYIPKMHISSNVMDLELQGRHSFENQIDYLLRVELGKVLFSRQQPQKMDPALSQHLAVTDDRQDHLLPVAITGTVDQPKVQLDKRALAGDFRKGLQKQGQDLRKIFQKQAPDTSAGTDLIFEWKDP